MGRFIRPLIIFDMGILNAIGSIGSAFVGALGGASQRSFERKEAEKQRQWNEEMMQRENDFSLEMWNKTNAYNSPVAQVERMREAGLNPLYFGLDGSSANGLESAQALGYDRASMDSSANPIMAGFDAAVKNAQLANIQANTAKQSEETLSEIQRREKVSAEIDVAKQELNNLMETAKLTDAQRRSVEKTIEWADRLNQANIAKTESEKKLSESQKKRIDELLEGEKLLQSKSIEDFDYKWKKIKAEIAKMSKESRLLALDIENYALNHASNGFMGTGLSFQNFIRAIKSKGIPQNVDYTDSDSVVEEFGNSD